MVVPRQLYCGASRAVLYSTVVHSTVQYSSVQYCGASRGLTESGPVDIPPRDARTHPTRTVL